jgi:two-component sensor histidine kinase
LISNCLKHGFPASVTGHISIDLHPLDAPQQWCLRVRDTGAGLPENFEEKRIGALGLQLVSNLAAQIGGSLDITPNQGKGVAFSVSFQLIAPALQEKPVCSRDLAHDVL